MVGDRRMASGWRDHGNGRACIVLAVHLECLSLRTAWYDMRKTNSDQLHGTLDMLVLKTVQNGPLHGYAIATRLEQLSNEVLKVEEGSLYPALYRMEARGWLSSDWALTETSRRARFYKLTRQGRAQLDAETESWGRLTTAVKSVLSS